MRERLVLVAVGLSVMAWCGCARQAAPVSDAGADRAGASKVVAEGKTPLPPEPVPESPATVSDPVAGEAPSSPQRDGPATDTQAKLSRKEVLNRCLSGVVVVTALDALGEPAGFGSGCVVAPGMVLTNFHVVSSAVRVRVQPHGTGDSPALEPIEAQGYAVLDRMNDLAILAVKGLPQNVVTLAVADPAGVEQFDEVFAIGHPDGLKFSTTPGFVNGVVKTSELPDQMRQRFANPDTEWVQTDAVIAGGSSGGPLLDEDGAIVGINTLLLTNRMGMAVGARHVRDILRKLADEASVTAFPVPGANVPRTKAVAEIERGFVREFQQFNVDLQRAGGDMAAIGKLMRRNNPGPATLLRCTEIIREQTGRETSIDALRTAAKVVATSGPPGRHYLDKVIGEAVADPSLIPPTQEAADALASLPWSPESERFLRSIIEHGETPTARATAGLSLMTAYTGDRAHDFSAEARELATDMESRFGDEKVDGNTVRGALKDFLASARTAIGSVAPEIRGTDADGVEFGLSEYRGKVVVLDFWADWCPHCRAMYGHEREMVERLRDRPFALLGINGDESERAKRVISAGTVTWRSWLDGTEGPIAADYAIQSWPTVYVLDKEGRIRFTDLRGEELEAAVLDLLGDREPDSAGTLVARGREWRHRPAGDDIAGDDWKQSAFDDSAWRLDPTPIGFGPVPCRSSFDLALPGARPVSTLLRTTFDAPADKISSSLLMRVRHVDGIVVSLNGKEVFRDQLPAASDQLTPATNLVPVSGQTSGTFVTLDGGLLLPTGNCLAVELHAASPYRAVALFDLEIGPLPDFDTLATDAPQSRKLEVAAMVCDIGLEHPEALALLEQWSTGSSPELQLQAATALGMNDRAIRLPGLANPDIVRAYLATGLGASKQALEVVKRDDLSPDQYTRALGLATVGCRMRDVAPEQVRSRFDEAESVRSMALYRCGRLEEAKASLEKSKSIRGDNPIDLAILALIERKNGDAATAGDLRDRCLKMGHDDEWRHSAGLASLLRELSRAFDGPME